MQELREKLNIGIPQEILELERRLEAEMHSSPCLDGHPNGLGAMHELRICLRQFLEERADE